MHPLAKRGLRTALVTGGLLMLGTGIASASENHNPDRPAAPLDSPADLGVAVPVHIAHNAMGTPLGQRNLPTVDRTVRTGDRPGSELVIPVDISGNAIAAGGDAATRNDSSQSAGSGDAVLAGGNPGTGTGNVVAVDHVAPVQVTGNAIGLGGNAHSDNTAHQSATSGGDLTTNGRGGVLAGNILAEQGATPVQVNGNAIAAGGQAHTVSRTDSAARSGGSLGTGGDGGTLAGNVGTIPIATPVELTGQSLSLAGNSSSTSQNSSSATAGNTDRDTPRGPTYLVTSGDPATLAGNVVDPEVSGPVAVNGNAGSLAGNSNAQGSTDTTTRTGGTTSTTGAGSTGSGNLVQVPVVEPTEAFGNALAAAGTAHTGQSNMDNSGAAGNSYTSGANGVLSGNAATAPIAGSNDLFGNGFSVLGIATGTASNAVATSSGGYAGTIAPDSVGSGNVAQAPVTAPAEVFGDAGSVAGLASGTVPVENKTTSAGGTPNALDDNGTLSSNVVSAPTVLPAQVFGDAAGVLANTSSSSNANNQLANGGSPRSTGRHGTGSGNIVQAATADPVQLFNDGASVLGNGSATGSNTMSGTAGGPATTTGRGGTAAGNIVNIADAGPVQGYGLAAAVLGNERAAARSSTASSAGGDGSTDGTAGTLAGDVLSVPVTQAVRAAGSAAAGAGNASSAGLGDTASRAGGDDTSSGDWGTFSGDLLAVPATGVTQAAADPVAVAGNAAALGGGPTAATSGGTQRTGGAGAFAARTIALPLGADLPVVRVPVALLGRAFSDGAAPTVISDGGAPATVEPPAGTAGLLGATELPGMAGLPRNTAPSVVPAGGPAALLDEVPGLAGLTGGVAPAAPGTMSPMGRPVYIQPGGYARSI